MAQSITITIDDVADVNAVPDLLTKWQYTGANNGAAKAAFIKAQVIIWIKAEIQQQRIQAAEIAAAIAAYNANTSIPIT